MNKPNTDATTLRLERTFDCTPAELWQAWTDPEQYAKWLNPAPDHDLVIHEWDLRVGGRVRFDMPQPDGNKNPQEGVFHVLEENERLVSGAPDKSFLLDVRFHPEGERTRLVVVATGVPPEFHAPATIGWNQGFDKLSTLLVREGRTTLDEREIRFSRVIDAPRAAVFAAFTDPKTIGDWWGPNGFKTTTHDMDVRPDGTWRFDMHGPDGTHYPNVIRYTEVAPPDRLAYLHGSEGDPKDDPQAFEATVTFTDRDGRTQVDMHIVMPTAKAREDALEFGAVEGGHQTLGRLAGFVASDGSGAA